MDGAWSWVLMGAWESTPPALHPKILKQIERAHSVPAISQHARQNVYNTI